MSFFTFIKSFFHRMLQLLSFGTNKLNNNLSIYVKTNTGKSVSVDLDPKWDIRNVKEIIAPKLGFQANEVTIIFAGKELSDTTLLQDCDLGQQSVLHAIKSPSKASHQKSRLSEEREEGSKPLSETLLDLQLTQRERNSISQSDKIKLKAHFYVFCSTCKKLAEGKLRIRCDSCKNGTFTVHSDPQSWEDVLLSKRITGECLSEPSCSVILHEKRPTFAEFYFKCSDHRSLGEGDEAVPLDLIKPNIKEIPCLSCSEISETVLVFSCNAAHVACLQCFRLYCTSRLSDRQFFSHPDFGYTLPCPVGCENSFIKEIHHFRLMTDEQYNQYQHFGAEEFVLQAGGVLCPQPGCGMGILADPECTKISCNSCNYVFCRNCLEGFHLGECHNQSSELPAELSCNYSLDSTKVNEARWDKASKVAIQVLTKPCPKCRTPTERSGGCMHMICTRAGCFLEWCWVCQTTWTRDCMAAHWFG